MSVKLFSKGGAHAVDGGETKIVSLMDKLIAWGRRPTAITLSDCLKGCAVIAFGTLVAALVFISAKAEMPKEESVEVQTVAEVEATPVPAVEIVSIDQTEALAMGIDAVISSEVKGDMVSDATLVMVGNVILNRTEDSRYPDTVDQVLMQPYQFSCFSTTGMKWVGRAANDQYFRQRCMNAAEAVMSGERMLSYGVVYVSGVKQGAVEAQLDGLYFCR